MSNKKPLNKKEIEELVRGLMEMQDGIMAIREKADMLHAKYSERGGGGFTLAFHACSFVRDVLGQVFFFITDKIGGVKDAREISERVIAEKRNHVLDDKPIIIQGPCMGDEI
jgi:hypothetical protein